MPYNHQAIRVALDDQGLSTTARHLALVLACLTDYPAQPARRELAVLAAVLGLTRAPAARAAAECEEAGYCVVKTSRGRGGKTVVYFGLPCAQLQLFADEKVQLNEPFLHLLGAPDNFSFKALKHKERARPRAREASAVEKHPPTCACEGTGWVDTSPRPEVEALVRCPGAPAPAPRRLSP